MLQQRLVDGSTINADLVGGAVASVSYDSSISGKECIILGSHRIRRLYRREHWRPSERASHQCTICKLLFNARYGQVISCDISGCVRLWDWKTGRENFAFSAASPTRKLEGTTTSEISAASLDESGERVVIGYTSGDLATWRLYNGEFLQSFEGNGDAISSVYHMDSLSTFVGSTLKGSVLFWPDRSDSEKIVNTRSINTSDAITSMHVSGNAAFAEAVTGNTEGEIIVWNALSSFAKGSTLNTDTGNVGSPTLESRRFGKPTLRSHWGRC